MGGTIAIGLLVSDGSVRYFLTGDISDYDVIHMTSFKTEFIASSVEEFFKDELFEEEDSAIRYLVKDVGALVIYRQYGSTDEYTLSKKKY